jgi:hypothetical protein
LLAQKVRAKTRRNISSRLYLAIGIAFGQLLAAQGGFLTGVVREPSGMGVPGAEVQIQSELTGARERVFCDREGKYASGELSPGTYKVIIRARGFRTAVHWGVAVHADEARPADFVIELIPLQQEITVQTARDEIDPVASGLAVSRQSPASTLPANGRDLHAYYRIIPGSIVTPAASGDGGQFTVNGQRPNTNTVRIDGVNGNTGLGVSALPGTYPGSSLPGMTVIGSTQDLASRDEIERVDLRSSDFAPEFGNRPGAQILVETRSGSKEFHGDGFAYARPAWLNSTDWFARGYRFPLDAVSLNGYGGSFGGPLFRNRTFFFVASEHERISDAALQLMVVPSIEARAAGAPYSFLLSAFPLPAGPNFNADESVGALPLQKQASVNNYSARVDQIVGHNGRLFARYSYVPSHSLTRDLDIHSASFTSLSATLGATTEWKRMIHDFRFNFSRVSNTAWAGAAYSDEAVAFQTFSNSLPTMLTFNGLSVLLNPYNVGALSIGGAGQLVSATAERSYQNQWEGTYTLAAHRGKHDFRLGADYIRLVPRTTLGTGLWTSSAAAIDIEQLLSGQPLGLTISYGKPTFENGQIPIGSLFAQDTFRVSDRLTLLYGLRWEFTPTRNISDRTGFFAVGSWNGPGTAFQPAGALYGLNSSNWPMNYKQFAPRVGLAYHFKRADVVFRAGAGVFYDDALGSLLYAVNLSPLNMWQYLPLPGNSGSVQQGGSAVLPGASTVAQQGFFIAPPPLMLPRAWEWRTALEKSFKGRSTLSLAYVGSAGQHLLRLEGSVDPDNDVLTETHFSSAATSGYEAFQAQFIGNLRPTLYTLISYTWGHSIDTGSLASAVFLVPPGSTDPDDRGSSNFDVRHNLNASLGYQIPAFRNRFCAACFRGWNLSSTVQARTGFPFDVTSTDRSMGLGFANTGRPSLIGGVPIWIQSDASPGARQLNRAAFAPVGEFVDGTLGRNVLTGPGLFQIDGRLRRQFRLFGSTSLELSATAFNLFNHANFSNPTGYLGSSLFGQPVSMQSLMLGSGSPTSGLTPIFQSGGPRTVDVNLKFSF